MKFKFLGLTILTLLFSTLILLTSCGSTSDKTEVSASDNSMSIIREYADSNGETKMPQIIDYQNVGVKGVESNKVLLRINNILTEDEIGADDIKTSADIQVLLYERDILDIPSSSGASSPIISVFTPVVTTPPPVQTTPTPTPMSTPILTPIQGTPPIESNFKIEDKKGNLSLTLKGEGNVTIKIGDKYDYENEYEVKEGNFNYLMGGIGVHGETIDINASDYLDNRDKVGTYVIYYILVDKKKKPILKIWRLVTITSDGDTDVVSAPSDSLLPSDDSYNGDHNNKNGIFIEFKYFFPTNTVYLGDKSLDFNPKDFKATKDDDKSDVTDQIEVDIVYNSNSGSEYDKTKEGSYEFKYSFDGKEIAKYSFTISKKIEPTPIPSPAPTINPTTPVPLNETITGYQDEVYHGKWVKPSKSACNANGGEYIDYNSKNNECTADWESAKRICSESGYELATKRELQLILHNCNDFFQTCYKKEGFGSNRYWSSYSISGNSTAWLVDFKDGFNGYYEKTSVDSVMCLRTTPTPTP